MHSKEFKNVFGEMAKSNGFQSAFGGWFKQNIECIAVLELQKSNYADYYELNIKIYVQGMFGNNYSINKDLVKRDMGDAFTRHPNEYRNVLDFDVPMDDEKRTLKLEELFREFIVPFTSKALKKDGIKELAQEGEIFLLPAVRKELESLGHG